MVLSLLYSFFVFKCTKSAANDDNAVVSCMDLLVPGVGELIGGSEREENYDVLKAAMTEQNLNTDMYQWYLQLRQ